MYLRAIKMSEMIWWNALCWWEARTMAPTLPLNLAPCFLRMARHRRSVVWLRRMLFDCHRQMTFDSAWVCVCVCLCVWPTTVHLYLRSPILSTYLHRTDIGKRWSQSTVCLYSMPSQYSTRPHCHAVSIGRRSDIANITDSIDCSQP